MAERLLHYQVRIWGRWRADHPKAKTLPMILPIVMYHGASSWSEPRSFDALLDVPAILRPVVEPHLVRFTYLLQDLSEISEEELLRQRFGDAVNAQVEQRIATASLEQVEAWTGRVLSAATLAEVLAG
jgi:phenylalanyl-tRNA synthetase beta subunit